MTKLFILIIGLLIVLTWFRIQEPVQPHELYKLHNGDEAYLQPDF